MYLAFNSLTSAWISLCLFYLVFIWHFVLANFCHIKFREFFFFLSVFSAPFSFFSFSGVSFTSVLDCLISCSRSLRLCFFFFLIHFSLCCLPWMISWTIALPSNSLNFCSVIFIRLWNPSSGFFIYELVNFFLFCRPHL